MLEPQVGQAICCMLVNVGYVSLFGLDCTIISLADMTITLLAVQLYD